MFKNCVKLSKKEFFLDYLLSIVIELAILFALILLFGLFIDKGKLLGEAKLIGDEMSSPTVGRLIYFIFAFVSAIATLILSSILAKKGKDELAFWLGFTSGILLWQSIGEAAWHYSVGGINFVQLESITSFPLVIMFVLLIVYGAKNKAFDWGVWCTIISFACNWLGHYITIGIYPFIENLINAHTWNVLAGSIGGALVFIYSIFYLLKKGDSKNGRMFASMLTYIALGIISLSIIDG